MTAPNICAIVIGRDEEDALARLLPRLRSMQHVRQVIFCDGGSRDGSQLSAAQSGALVLEATGGRGAQLRAGAAQAGAAQAAVEAEAAVEVLWFLHADAWPGRSSAASIARAVCDARVLGGNFRLRFASRSPWARAFEIIARLQRLAGIYYGDSGLWVRREVYEELGGFEPWPLFEDYDFARRLHHLARKRGARTACLRPVLLASPRRFEREPWRVLKVWMTLQRRFQKGEDPRQLAREYHSAR